MSIVGAIIVNFIHRKISQQSLKKKSKQNVETSNNS